jgi:hypothetical protein
LDLSSRFGQPDNEGWFYASTFDRLGEMMKNATGTGIASKTSIVRRRRWVRSMICIADELNEAIKQRVDLILSIRRNIETTLKEKETAVRSVKFYEENRSFVFSQSLHLATQGTLNTLSLLKELASKLKNLKIYLQERAIMEREYAHRLDGIALKFFQNTQTPDSPVKRTMIPRQTMTLTAVTTQHLPPTPTTPIRPSKSITNNNNNNNIGGSNLFDEDEEEGQGELLQEGEGEENADCSEVFFSRIHNVAQANAMLMQEYSLNLNLVITEIDQMALEIQSVLKEARLSFRKNR